MKKNLIDLLLDPQKQTLLFSIILIFNLLVAFILVISPVTSIKGAEPNVIYTVQMTMLNKQWMYQDPEAIPFAATQYTPFYYMICGTAANLFSLTPGEEVVAIYRISRAISFLASVLSGCFIFLTLHKVYEVNTRWSYFTALICILCTVPWCFATRPDSLMAMFLFSSLYFFCKNLKKGGSTFKYLIAAGAAAAFSFFSKQNGLIISIIAGSYLLLSFRIKELGLFLLGFLLGTLTFLLLFNGFYSRFFFMHFIEGINNGIDIQTAITKVYHSYVLRFGTVTAVTIVLALVIISRLSLRGISDEFRFLLYTLLVSILFSFATALKVGSDINYFHETIAISLIILCVGGQLIKSIYTELESPLIRVSIFCVTFAFAVSLTLSSFLAVGLRNIKRMTEHDDVYKKELLGFIKEEAAKHPGDFHLISDEAFVNNAFPLQSILPHHDIAGLWYARKIFDFTNLKKAISQGEIFLYIGNGDKVGYYDIDLEENFYFLRIIDGYKVYKTKYVDK